MNKDLKILYHRLRRRPWNFTVISDRLIEIEKNANKIVVKILIDNKCDLEDIRVITYNQRKEFADIYELKLIEASAKKILKVNEAFSDY